MWSAYTDTEHWNTTDPAAGRTAFLTYKENHLLRQRSSCERHGWRDPSSRCRPIRALSIMIEHSSVSDTFTCPPLLFKENAEAVLIYISHISSLHLYTCSTVSQVVALHLFVLFHYFCCFNGKPGPWVRSFVSPHVNMRMTTKLSWITDILSRTFGIILHMRAGSTPADSLHSYSGPVLTFSPLVKTIKSS